MSKIEPHDPNCATCTGVVSEPKPLVEKTTRWTDEEREEMAERRYQENVAGGAYELDAHGQPIRVSSDAPIAGCGDTNCKGKDCGSIVCGLPLRPDAVGVPVVASPGGRVSAEAKGDAGWLDLFDAADDFLREWRRGRAEERPEIVAAVARLQDAFSARLTPRRERATPECNAKWLIEEIEGARGVLGEIQALAREGVPVAKFGERMREIHDKARARRRSLDSVLRMADPSPCGSPALSSGDPTKETP